MSIVRPQQASDTFLRMLIESALPVIRDFGTIPYDLIADVLPIMLPDQLLQVEAASPVSLFFSLHQFIWICTLML